MRHCPEHINPLEISVIEMLIGHSLSVSFDLSTLISWSSPATAEQGVKGQVEFIKYNI